ncbi:MAG: tetratricopeptide repeat protein [Thermoguttaceae bacterium]
MAGGVGRRTGRYNAAKIVLGNLKPTHISQTDLTSNSHLTLATLAGLVDVAPATVRHWVRHRLLAPTDVVGRLLYFDEESLLTAKRLAEWHRGGVMPAELARQVAAFRRHPKYVGVPLRNWDHATRHGLLLTRTKDGNGAGEFVNARNQRVIDLETVREDDDATQTVLDAAFLPDAHDAAALRAAAESCDETGRWNDAIDFYRASLAAGGSDAETCFLMADLLYRMGDLTAARERYAMAIELDEDYAEARLNLGCVLAELGDWELAAAAFEGALKTYPEYTDAHERLAEARERLANR